MSVWKTQPITKQPEIILTRWRIVELPNGDRHFNGWNILDREGRISSRIVEIDPETRSGKTHSGRIYRLDGPSGYDSDAEYVLKWWLDINEINPSDIKILVEIFPNE